MIKISEANLSQAMKFAFDEFIEPHDPDKILAYKPFNQKDKDWLRNNPTTGIIYLKKHPNVKEAWVLVKFESREKSFGTTTIPQQRTTIKSIEDFEEFFGVKPTKNFTNDTVVMVNSDYKATPNKNPKRDFDETTPNFYMYTNHLKVNLDKLVKRLYRIDAIITASGGTTGNLYKIPYSATDIKN